MEHAYNFQALEHATYRIISLNGQSFLFFGGTAYLGLNKDPEFIQLYTDGIVKYGLNNGTSRNNNAQLRIYQQAEQQLAHRFGFEDAAVVSSGFLAAQMTVCALANMGKVIQAPDSHPALWTDASAPAFRKSFPTWVADTVDKINASLDETFIIASNTFDYLRPTVYDFSGFARVDARKAIYFVLDDSHGIGIRQTRLIDDLKHFGTYAAKVIVVASLAKGLGLDAGVVMADRATIKQIKQTSIFAGASPPAPAAMHTLIHATHIYQQRVAQLRQNMESFVALLGPLTGQYIEGLPVFYFPQTGLYDHLLKAGIVISSFRYPLPTSPPLNRVVLTSRHTLADIQLLAAAIKSYESR